MTHIEQVTIEDWLAFFEEVVLLFNYLGYAFAKAFSDLSEKIAVLKANENYWNA